MKDTQRYSQSPTAPYGQNWRDIFQPFTLLNRSRSIPENEEIMSVIAVGKAAEEPGPRPRKALEEVTRFF